MLASLLGMGPARAGAPAMKHCDSMDLAKYQGLKGKRNNAEEAALRHCDSLELEKYQGMRTGRRSRLSAGGARAD